MRIALFLRRGSGFHEVVPMLEERGAEVDVRYADEEVADLASLRPAHDLYVLKSRTLASLSLAGALHEAGARILNPYPIAAAFRNKVVATQLLRRARIPLPASYVAGEAAALLPLLEEGPLVVKPYGGSQGVGVTVVRTPAELAAAASANGSMVFAQRYHPPRGRDRKLYRIGDRVFGVKRIWPPRTAEDKRGEPFPVAGELRDVALRLGRALGLDLYGFDVVETDRGPLVVDFSPFPGFKGVPDAAALLAAHIHAKAQEVAAR